MRAYGYTRVSSEEQSRGGVSLEMQAERIRAYAKSQGWTVARVFEDAGHSGTTLQRPALQRMLESLEGIGAVVVWKVDRLSRKQRHLLSLLEETLEPKGVGFVSVTESFETMSPMGMAMVGLLGVFAQLEHATIVHRTREALRHKQSNGQHVGRTPYGFTIREKKLYAVPNQMSIVAEVRRQRESGLTLREIADWLNENRVPTQRGGRWSLSTVRNLVRDPRYETTEPIA